MLIILVAVRVVLVLVAVVFVAVVVVVVSHIQITSGSQPIYQSRNIEVKEIFAVVK